MELLGRWQGRSVRAVWEDGQTRFSDSELASALTAMEEQGAVLEANPVFPPTTVELEDPKGLLTTMAHVVEPKTLRAKADFFLASLD